MLRKLTVSERWAYRILAQIRSTQRCKLIVRDDEDALPLVIVDLDSEYGRYSYQRITALLRQQGLHINHKRMERIWRRKGLKLRQKQPKRDRKRSRSCSSRMTPDYIRSDNAAKFTAMAVGEWLHRLDALTLFIKPGCP